jgi:hypothetical protein
MNLNDVSTQLLFTTVPLWADLPSGNSSATAFIYNAFIDGKPDQSIPLLITNYHAVENATRVVVEFIESKDGLPEVEKKLLVDIDMTQLLKYFDKDLDLVAIPLGPLLNEREALGRPLFFRSIDEKLIPKDGILKELSALEEIVFIGYPSGIRDDINSTPLIRRGITSTPVWNNFQGSNFFLIDAGVFPGSSGSPVFILNQGAYPTKSGLSIGSRILFLGVLSQTMLRSSANEVYLGIGKVLRSDHLSKFIQKITQSLTLAEA